MCSAIAARITCDTGRASRVATVSNASACSADSRIVMALTAFITAIVRRDTTLVKYHDTVVSLYR